MTKWICIGCECMCNVDDHCEEMNDPPTTCIYSDLEGDIYPGTFLPLKQLTKTMTKCGK